MELHGTFPWNFMENVDAGIFMEIGVLFLMFSMGNVLILHANIFRGNLWRNFHGNWCPNPPWNSMENFPWNSMFFTRAAPVAMICDEYCSYFTYLEKKEHKCFKSLQSSFCILHPACILLSVCSLYFTLSLYFTTGPQSAFYTDEMKNRTEP